MERRSDSDRGLVGWTVAATFAAWLVATLGSNHPSPLFDRIRDHDRTGLLIPNWRFFAPEPAQHDFQVAHRVLTADGRQTAWQQTTSNPPRSWRRALWAPDRRREKAVFDVCSHLVMAKAAGNHEVSRLATYRLLRDLVEGAVRREYAGRAVPQGFQFVIARTSGHDQDEEPQYILVSEFQPLTGEAAA